MKAPVGAGKEFAPYDEGTHSGRIQWVIDLGMQPKTWAGVTTDQRQWLVGYACPEVVREDNGEPLILSERFNFSMSAKANLRKRVEQIFGRSMTDKQAADFDVEKIAGRPVAYNVVHNESSQGRIFANVQSVMPLPKGSKAPELPEPVVCMAGDVDKLKDLPEWVGDKCTSGWPLLAKDSPADDEDSGDFDDDIPF